MISRLLEKEARYWASKLPVVTITGPRQSGKTTFVQTVFPHYKYISLEVPSLRKFAEEDPDGFLKHYGYRLIIDEAQYVPALFSYIQIEADKIKKPGLFILTGSQNFLLLEKITQSLAGRVAILNLLPFSTEELKNTTFEKNDSWQYIRSGMYPRIYDQSIPASKWLPMYIETYIERDVRKIINVADLSAFRKFMSICAGHSGQMVNFSKIGGDIGISYQTIKRWISILEASFIIFLLPPWFKNFRKRIVKTPKLYFYDTGIACSLLNIQSAESLEDHWAKGALFENFIISELIKNRLNCGKSAPFYFYRNNSGNEVDLITDEGNYLNVIEIKSGSTIHDDFLKGVLYFQQLEQAKKNRLSIIYNGEESQKRKNIHFLSWKNLNEIS